MSNASENGAAADRSTAVATADDANASVSPRGAEDDLRGASAEGDGVDPKRSRKRRRRRGKKGGSEGKPQAPGSGSPATASPEASASSSPPPRPSSPAFAALAGGLLSHIDDREIPCIHEGCDNTWTWTAREQIEAFGQPPPRRACAECRSLRDTTLGCSVEGCARTWVWTRDAQLKHRAWAKRQHHQDHESGRGGKRNRGKRRADAPPRRKCELCQQKLATLEDRVSVCKVHGCTREVILDKDSQLKAWALLGTDDLSAEFTLPKRMCDVCREFCRTHLDREVPCGRPDCERTWTYKTGAQLQAFLAGRLEDPIRLCGTCSQEEAVTGVVTDVEGSVEIMPCIVVGCDGTWLWHEGMDIAPARDGDEPLDRMCNAHRVGRGAEERATIAIAAPSEAAPEAPPAEPEPAEPEPEALSNAGS